MGGGPHRDAQVKFSEVICAASDSFGQLSITSDRLAIATQQAQVSSSGLRCSIYIYIFVPKFVIRALGLRCSLCLVHQE